MRRLNWETRLWFWLICVAVGVSLLPRDGAGQEAAEPFREPGTNVALRKPYSLTPRPNYKHCTDPDDTKQLTNGKSVREASGNFCQQPSCVGWSRCALITITIDLGKIEPVAGLSFSTGAGAADMGWPAGILILMSDDGREFHYVGELCSLSAKFGVPAPSGYQDHQFRTDDLGTHGRFVRLAITGGVPFQFCDGIEVYRGPNKLLKSPLEGQIITDLATFHAKHKMGVAIQSRIGSDIVRCRMAVRGATLQPGLRKRLSKEIATVKKANQTVPEDLPPDYRSIFPLNENHARVFGVVAELRRAEGFPPFFLWHNTAGTFWAYGTHPGRCQEEIRHCQCG